MDNRDLHAFLLVHTPSEVIERVRLQGCLDPEINKLRNIVQDKEHHPEGDVYTHTLMVVDEARKIANREKLSHVDTAILLLAALLHDVGKITTTEIHADDRITAYGHPEAGVNIAREFLQHNSVTQKYINQILILVKEHMIHIGYYTPDITTRVARRIKNRIQPVSIEMISYIVEADMKGRGVFHEDRLARMYEIVEAVNTIDSVERPDPFLSGDDIMQLLGIDPSSELGKIKALVYDLQLKGRITDREQAEQFLLLSFT